MPIKYLNDKGDFLVQVQRGLRRSQRGRGNEREAKRIEALLLASIQLELDKQQAAAILGFDPSATSSAAGRLPPTLREFYVDRWSEHAKVVQNERTRSRSVCPFQYLLYYLGDRRLTEVGEPSVVKEFVEKMKANGPLSFSQRQDGTPRRVLTTELTNATVNKSLQGLRALLYLAHAERVISSPPNINVLPEDDSDAIVPPTEEQFQQLLTACETFHPIAPLMRHVTEFGAETGLRPGEVFALTLRSVDKARNCIRIETQGRVKMLNGKPWKPKCNKFREVPLSARARAIIDARPAAGPDDLVFPNNGGAPYVRLDYAPDGAGKGFFRDAVKLAGLKGSMTFKHLRHLFAVRLLTRGVPITVVSELLGHSNIQITVKRYGRFSSDARVKWDAVKVLDDAESDDDHTDDDERPTP